MLAGDFRTMALADVLQWIDSSRVDARLTVHGADGGVVWMETHDRRIVATGAPVARGALASGEAGQRALAEEQLFDLFLVEGGRFEVEREVPRSGGCAAVDLRVPFLVMEGLRLLDEWPALEAMFPSDTARLAATDRASAGVSEGSLGVVQAAIVEVAERAPALAEARLVLGLSRPALLRRVEELRARGLVEVEGIPHGPDVEGSLIRQAKVLLREEQFAEAAHVFRTLVASNPEDARARRLLAEAERRQLEAGYRRFRESDVVRGEPGRRPAKLRATDHAVLDRLTGPCRVDRLVLLSPLRELETLETLKRLAARGLVTVERAADLEDE